MRRKRMLSPAEISDFCSQIGWLIHAGMTPVDSLQILINDSKNLDGKQIFQDIYDVCKKGEHFSKSLSSTGVFPEYCIQLITLGEESGNLDECLQSLAVYYEKEDNLRQSFKSAVSYPLLMILMMFIVIYVLMSQVMPVFRQVFDELGTEMSGVAASLLHTGEALNRYTWLFLLILLLISLLYLGCSKVPFMKRLTRRFLNWFPPTKTYLEQYATQRFASGMAMTLRSGIDTYNSLDLVAGICSSDKLREKILASKEDLKKGTSFSEAISNSGIFSNLHSRMIAIGFRSGNIDSVMSKIADSYEKETERKIQTLISILEPTIVIILSIVVGLILLSVILPLMGIMSSIG